MRYRVDYFMDGVWKPFSVYESLEEAERKAKTLKLVWKIETRVVKE